MNEVLHKAVQAVDALGAVGPAPVRRAARSVAVKVLQREQRTRPALTTEDRCLLIPHFAQDLNLLERVTGRSFAHWRDPQNSLTRRSLDIDGRFGTAFTSIDRPLRN